MLTVVCDCKYFCVIMDTITLPNYDAASLFTSSDEKDFLGRGNYASFRVCKHKDLEGPVVVKTLNTTGSKETIKENVAKYAIKNYLAF